MELSGQLHAQVTLLLRKQCQYPLCRRLGRPQNWSGCYGKRKILPLPSSLLLYRAILALWHSKLYVLFLCNFPDCRSRFWPSQKILGYIKSTVLFSPTDARFQPHHLQSAVLPSGSILHIVANDSFTRLLCYGPCLYIKL
jgi:hypothetical protein